LLPRLYTGPAYGDSATINIPYRYLLPSTIFLELHNLLHFPFLRFALRAFEAQKINAFVVDTKSTFSAAAQNRFYDCTDSS